MSRICAAAVLAIAFLFSACAKKSEPAIDVPNCIDARVFAYGSIHKWELHAVNTCNQSFTQVYFLVKYMDLFGERVGVDAVAANYVAPRERISHRYDLPQNLSAEIYSVQIRKISGDPIDALK